TAATAWWFPRRRRAVGGVRIQNIENNPMQSRGNKLPPTLHRHMMVERRSWVAALRCSAKEALHRVRDATRNQKRGREAPCKSTRQSSNAYLIVDSLNSTCLRATGSYFFLTSLSVMVREFFLAT